MEHLDEVLALLDLSRDGDGFLGGQPASRPDRVFGGQVMAQALRAACSTVPDGRLPHSLHAYFIRAGVSDEPIRFDVARVRDGGSISSRHVVAAQSRGTILHLSASFGASAPGLPAPALLVDVPLPEALPGVAERLASYADELEGWWVRPRAFDLRYIDPHPRELLDQQSPDSAEVLRMWVRTAGDVPDDPITHACLAAYLSDMTLLDPVLAASRRTSVGPGSTASLDHAMWFHAIPDVTGWLLYERRLASLLGQRGLAQGVIRDAQGRRWCSVTQEGYLSDRPGRLVPG